MNRHRTEWARRRPAGDTGAAPPLVAYLQTAAALGAGVVGLAAYVYLLGGAVMWLGMTAARLPSDDATDAFQNRQLLSMGLKALFFELLLLGAVTAIVWAAWRAACTLEQRRLRKGTANEAAPPPRSPDKPLDEYVLLVLLRSVVVALSLVALLASGFQIYSEANAVLLAAGVLALGLVIGAADIVDKRPGWLMKLDEQRWVGALLQAVRVLVSVGVVVAAVIYMAAPLGLTVLVLVVLLQFSERVMRLAKVPTMKELIVPVLILAAALNVVIVPYLATPPVTFDRATVLTTEGREITGAYIGRSSAGIYLATCRAVDATTSTEARLLIVPADEVKRFVLGGFRYSFDFGKRPSLLGLFGYYAQARSIESKDDGFQLDLREERDVCGINSPA
jgi:hypothetical protein